MTDEIDYSIYVIIDSRCELCLDVLKKVKGLSPVNIIDRDLASLIFDNRIFINHVKTDYSNEFMTHMNDLSTLFTKWIDKGNIIIKSGIEYRYFESTEKITSPENVLPCVFVVTGDDESPKIDMFIGQETKSKKFCNKLSELRGG